MAKSYWIGIVLTEPINKTAERIEADLALHYRQIEQGHNYDQRINRKYSKASPYDHPENTTNPL